MREFSASRLVRGNELVPTKIIITDTGVLIREPGFFRGQERFIPFRHISSVQIDTPFIGYSTIEIQTTGQYLFSVHGFNSYEVKAMRELIMQHIY